MTAAGSSTRTTFHHSFDGHLCFQKLQSQGAKNMSHPETKIFDVHALFFRVTAALSSVKVRSLSLLVRFFGVQADNSSRKGKSRSLNLAMAP